MDYEKKYKEAFEWMRELYPGLHGATKEDAEHFFPELRESEDEKMMRVIALALTDVPEERFTSLGTTLKDCLAYLEKQKDLDKMIVVSPEVWDNAITDAYENGKRDSEKQKEQKPEEPDWCHHKVDLSGCSEEYMKAYYDGWNNCNQQHSQCKAEQKPAEIDEYKVIKKHITEGSLSGEVNKRLKECGWCVTDEKSAEWSEVDKDKLERVIAFLAENETLPEWKLYVQKLKEWLKSLPERFKLKPMKEWNEEDEKNLELVTDCVYEFYPDPVMKYKLKDWLKSLRPQPRKELSIEKAIQWLDDTFYFLDNSSGRGRDCEITTNDFDSLEEMYDSFRKAVIVNSEPSWKPTEDEERLINTAISFLKDFADKGYENAVECIDWLKSKLNGNSCK